MTDQEISWKRVLVIAGSVVAYYMGAGYATGQEMLQYFAAYGLISLVSCVIYFLFFWYLNDNFMVAGHQGYFENGMQQVCRYFCGKYIGSFYDWFATIFCYLCFVVMCSGGGAVLWQQYGLPTWVGVLLIAVTGVATVVFGLGKMVDVIGCMGPVLILLCIASAVLGIIFADTGISRGSELAPTLDIMKAAPSWWQAIISDIGFAIMWMVAFFAGIGRQEKTFKNARYGALLGIFMVSLAFGIVSLAEIANIEMIQNSQAPLLLIINNISPMAAHVYSVVVFLGVYTTACPLLWTSVNRIAEEKTTKYRLLTIVLGVAGFFIAVALPFNRLVNIVYVINGYVGFIFAVFVVARNVRDYLARKVAEADTYDDTVYRS